MTRSSPPGQRQVAGFAASGVSEVQAMLDRHPVEYTEQLAERVIPRVAEIA